MPGLRVSYSIGTRWGVLVPQGRLEWEHEFDKDALTTNTTFLLDSNGNPFTLTGDDPDRNYFNLGLSLVAILPNGLMPFIDYEGLLGYDDLDRHRITAGG